MTKASGIRVFDEILDPEDIRDYKLDFTALLDTTEKIAAMELDLSAEATDLGLELIMGSRAPDISDDGKSITFWLRLLAEIEDDEPSFYYAGQVFYGTALIDTDSNPSRTIRRSFGIRIAQR